MHWRSKNPPVKRMMNMIKGLRTAIYHVNDLAKAKAWYSQVLEHEPYFDQPFYVGYEVGGFELGLVPGGHPGAGRPGGVRGGARPPSRRKKTESLGGVDSPPFAGCGERNPGG